jgi:hypothetical protein
MARFTSKYSSLVLQDEKGVWAEFVEELYDFDGQQRKRGVLITDDPAVIKRLGACEDGSVERVDNPKGPGRS